MQEQNNLYTNSNTLNIEKITFSKVKDSQSAEKTYSWKESIIGYNYTLTKDGKTFEQSDSFIYEFPVLSTQKGIIAFEDKQSGTANYAVIAQLTTPESLQVIQDLKDIKNCIDGFVAKEFEAFTGNPISVYKESLGFPDIVPDIKVAGSVFPSLYKAQNDKYKDSFAFKIISSKKTGEIITKFIGIDGKEISPKKLYGRPFTFQPYIRIFKIFHGQKKVYQVKMTEALILSFEAINSIGSHAQAKAQKHLMNDPEKSRIFSEEVEKLEELTPTAQLKSEAGKSLAKSTALGVGKTSPHTSDNDDEDDDDTVTVPIPNSIKEITSAPKKRTRG